MPTCEELDNMHDSKKFNELYDIIKKMVEEDNEESAEILWRYARAHFDKAQELPENDKRREPFIHKGREIAEKALAADEENWTCHKWMAILLSSEGAYVAKKKKIEDAFNVKKHADKAHALNPEDSTTLHFLGRFAFTIASISWVERKIAATLMATPPTATYEEALNYFLEAEKKRSFLLNQVWIAKTYLKMNDKAKAKEWFTTVKDTEPESESDKNDIKEAVTALKKL